MLIKTFTSIRRYETLCFSGIVCAMFLCGWTIHAEIQTFSRDKLFWTDRLVPLPKEVSTSTSQVYSPSDIAIVRRSPSTPQVETAIDILNTLVFDSNKRENKVLIELFLNGKPPIPPVSQELLDRLEQLPNKEQAYVIRTTPRKDGRLHVALVGNSPVALIYAARTYAQLIRKFEIKPVRPAILPPDLTTDRLREVPIVNAITKLEIPLVEITDWPDMTERGIWGFRLKSFIPWLAKWKLNNLGLTGSGFQYIDDNGKPFFTQKLRPTVEVASRLGIKATLPLTHLEQSSLKDGRMIKNVLKHKDGKIIFHNPQWVDLRPAFTITESTRVPVKLDFSTPLARNLLTSLFLQQAKAVEGIHDNIEVWLSESVCPAKGKTREDQYLNETKACIQAWKVAKKQYPNLKLRVMLTQGSFPVTNKILSILPKDVAAFHYSGSIYGEKGLSSGSCTYITDHNPMIPPHMTAFAESGGLLGVVPQFMNSFEVYVPWTAPQFVKFRCDEFVSKKLFSIYGYAIPNPDYHAFNIMALAEWTWNAKGRSPEEFSRAYATVTGIEFPEYYSKWAVKAGETGWELASSKFIRRLSLDPTCGFLGGQAFNHCFSYPPLTDPTNMERLIKTASEAKAMSRLAMDRDMFLESTFTHAALDAFNLLAHASTIMRSNDKNEGKKVKLGKILNNLDRRANDIAYSLMEWRDIHMHDNWLENGSKRLIRPAMALLYTRDLLRMLTAPLNISEPVPRFQPLELMKVAPNMYKSNRSVCHIDVTNLLSTKGGAKYHVVFNRLSGDCGKVFGIALMGSNDENGNPVELVVSPDAFNGSYTAIFDTFSECRLTIPEIAANYRKLYLKINLYGKGGYGLISLRQVWSIDGFPDSSPPWPKQKIKTNQKVENSRSDSTTHIMGKKSGAIRVAVTPGIGSPGIIKALNQRKKIQAFEMEVPSERNLKNCDVLLVTQSQSVPTLLIRSSKQIIAWVENGGGALFFHDAVGFRRQMAMFDSLGQGIDNPKHDKLKVVKNHPITQGLKTGEIYSPNFQYDHVVMRSGEKGVTLIVDEIDERPVVIAGEHGKGRVVLNGMLLGISGNKGDAGGHPSIPTGNDLTLLLNSVKWAARNEN